MKSVRFRGYVRRYGKGSLIAVIFVWLCMGIICAGFVDIGSQCIGLVYTETFMVNSEPQIVIVYDRLYEYGTNASEVLLQYMSLKSEGENVILLQADDILHKTPDDTSDALSNDISDDMPDGALDLERNEDAVIIIVRSSFVSADRLQSIYQHFQGYDIRTTRGLDGENAVPLDESFVDFSNVNDSVVIAIDGVYPFSDLNRLMDMAEILNMAGIEYIVSVAPVYENYQMQAYDNYIEVLQYISKIGGHLFVHYPIENKSGTYNLDPRKLFARAISEFRQRGLDIVGIEVPQDKMFTHLEVYDGLGFQCLLTTDAEKKIPSKTNMSTISRKLLDYQMVSGIEGQKCITISVNDPTTNLQEMLNKFNGQQIMVKDFQIDKKYKRSTGHSQLGTQGSGEQGTDDEKQGIDGEKQGIEEKQGEDKTQMEQFLESEMEKIAGENLEEQEKIVEGYDISGLSSIVIKVALVILCILAVLAVIGRYLERKKFYK